MIPNAFIRCMPVQLFQIILPVDGNKIISLLNSQVFFIMRHLNKILRHKTRVT